MRRKSTIGIGLVAILTIVSFVAIYASSPGTGTSVEQLDTQGEIAQASNAQTEGIQVHGRWTIDVSEPDGKLVSRTEFDNSLENLGDNALSLILAHQNAAGSWILTISGSSLSNGPCNANSGSPAGCAIYELPATAPVIVNNDHFYSGLTVDAPISGPNEGSFVLTASVTAENDTDVANVGTMVILCDNSVAPVDALSCTALQYPFTSKTLNPVVPVLSGQSIDVTVVVSFS